MKTINSKLFLTTVVLLLFGVTNLHAQWLQGQKIFGGSNLDYGYAIDLTSDGGYIMAGKTNSFGVGGDDVYLVKLDSEGDMLWSKTYGGTENDEAYSVEQTNDGGYIIGARTASFGAQGQDMYIIKTDAGGSTLWAKAYGRGEDELIYAIKQTSDSGYIAVGSTGFPIGSDNTYIVKTDASGTPLWNRVYRESKNEYAFSVAQTGDGGYIVAGATYSFGAADNYDIFLMKIDFNGDMIWTKTYGGTNDEWAKSVTQTSDSGYIVTGITSSFGAGLSDVYLIKTDATGDTLWTKTYGSDSSDGVSAIELTSDGGYIVAGGTNGFGAGGTDVYLIKIDSIGNVLWSKAYGGTGDDYGNALKVTSDGSYIIMGSTNSFGAGDLDIYLIKTDSNGNSDCNYMNANTQVSSGSIVNNITMLVTSGTTTTNTTIMVTSPSSSDSNLCNIEADFFTADTIICEGDCIDFTDLSTGDSITGWAWTFWGATPGSSTDQYPTGICYDTVGTYDVMLIATSASDTDILVKTAYINVVANTLNVNLGSDTAICSGDNITLDAGAATAYSWSTGGTTQTIVVNTVGTYRVTVTDTVGCQDADTINVTFLPAMVMSVAFNDTIICEGESVQLSAGGGDTYLWKPSAGLSQTDINNPVATPVDTITVYTVIVNDTCSIDSVEVTITLRNCDTIASNLFVPNAFSPNGDGDNDVLFIRGSGIKEMTFIIYNRWGEKVFQLAISNYQLSIDNGWDGTYKGKKVSEGVYVYYLEATGIDGEEYFQKGNITLIR